MTDRYNFTEEEWRLVVAAPFVVGISAMVFDPTLTSLVVEVASLGKIVKQAAEHYGHNALIQACTQDTGAFDTREAERVSGMQISNLLEMFEQVLAIVDLRAEPGEVQDFRYFLYEVGEKMTEAAGEGILGTGPKTSDRERDFLTKLEGWLGI